MSVSGYCHTVIVFLAFWFCLQFGQNHGLFSSNSSLEHTQEKNDTSWDITHASSHRLVKQYVMGR